MIIQRVIVFLYSAFVFLRTRVRHKRWIALVLVALYIALRTTGRTPVVGKAKKIHINQMITKTVDEGIHMDPTPVTSLWTDHDFECIGWKRIHSCIKEPKDKKKDDDDPPETKKPEKDFLNCTEPIGPQMAGHCIVRNRTSGDLYRMMISTCDSLPNGQYHCDMARNFSEYAIHSVNYEHTPLAPSLALPSVAAARRKPTNGVIMIVYEKVLPSAYATIRMLRLHGCQLAVELWYRPDEMSIDNPIIHRLLAEFNVRMRPIFDNRAKGFHVKPYAVYYSNFDNILLLDADNLPAKDPTYLFEEPEFLRTGAIFWPDYWQPSNSLFQLTNTSLLWQLTGVEYVDQFEQESGQVLINRIKSKKALDKLMFYSTHQPRLLEELHLIWGDKDLFRLAWLNSSQPFHYIQFPPAVGGLDLKDKGIFCGLAMIQHDVQGNLIFFHRNSIKLDGKPDQPRIMTHIQEYSLEGDPKEYQIFQAVYAHKECCYYIGTQTLPDGQPATQVTPLASTTYASIEELAIQFSIEGRNLLLAEESTPSKPLRWSEKKLAQWRAQEIVGLFLLVYVLFIIAFVWCKARPARERLPSRWKPMDSKEN
jgi:alpha 1,2-mannosyltransferase